MSNLLLLLLSTSLVGKMWGLSAGFGAFVGLMQGWRAGGWAMELLAAFERGLPEGAGMGAPLRGLLDSNLLPRDCHEPAVVGGSDHLVRCLEAWGRVYSVGHLETFNASIIMLNFRHMKYSDHHQKGIL